MVSISQKYLMKEEYKEGLFVGYRYADLSPKARKALTGVDNKMKPLFAFGHGLSYTTFSYGDAQVSRDKIVIPVTNTGSRDGDEVVQLYVNRPSDAEGPVKTLRGFKRVNIPAGQTVQVEFPLNDETFTWWDKYTNTMLALSGEFKLLYGGTSDSDFLKNVSVVRP